MRYFTTVTRLPPVISTAARLPQIFRGESAIGLIIVIPLYWMIITAFKTQTAIFTYPIEWFPKEFTLQNFVDLFSRFPFGKVLRNSAIVSVSYSIISIITCSMAAFAFAKIPFRGSEALLKVYLATLMIPFQSTLIPLFMLFNSAGLSNTYGSVIIPSLFRVFGIFLLVVCARFFWSLIV